MKNTLVIKGCTIGEGKPIVCVPIIQRKSKDVIEEIKQLVDQKTQMIEWRIDFFEHLEQKDKIIEVLKEIEQVIKTCVFLLTYRSKAQGGNGMLSQEQYQNLLYDLAKQESIDLLDVEIYSLDNPSEVIQVIKKKEVKVIASHHDFAKTPSMEEMETYFFDMNQSQADILKLAVMPHNMEDVFRLLEFTNKMKEQYEKKPLVTMSMGKEGMMSRFLGELCGSAITFGTYKQASAPGQIDAGKLNELLQKIHELL